MMMSLHKVLNKVVAGLCLCILAAVLTGCGDDVGGEHCDGVNEFLDRFYSNSSANAADPVIINQSTHTVPIGPEGSTFTIAVSASVNDGGTLSYQWFRSAGSAGWVEIAGAIHSAYEVRADSLATYTFYVEVTNTNNSASGSKIARRSTPPITVSVNVIVNAQVPDITAQPVGGTVSHSLETYPLSVTAVVGSGVLTYQWFMNTVDSNTGGLPIPDATGPAYAAPMSPLGTRYYYVAVTNTIAENDDGGRKTESVVSDVAALTVNSDRNALTPEITAYPGDTAVTAGTPLTLTVAATVADGGQISYAWYRNNSRNNTGGEQVGEGSSYIVPTAPGDTGMSYYYAVATNTIEGGEGVGMTTAPVRGAAVLVRVNEAGAVVTYTLKADNPGSHGTVYLNQAPGLELSGLSAGSEVNIQAIAAPGYTFSSWTVSGDGAVAGLNVATTTIIIRGNVTLTANFAVSAVTYELTAHDPGREYGEILLNGGQNLTLTGLRAGDTVSIQAKAAAWYRFTGWTVSENGTVADPTAANTVVIIRGNVRLFANFDLLPPAVSHGLICAPGEAWVRDGDVDVREALVFNGDESSGGIVSQYSKNIKNGENNWSLTNAASWTRASGGFHSNTILTELWGPHMSVGFDISSYTMSLSSWYHLGLPTYTKKGGGPENW